MKKLVLIAVIVAGIVGVYVYHAYVSQASYPVTQETVTPLYLYKILSVEDWAKSKDQKMVKLSLMDDAFIHLSTDEQIDKIVKKFWAQESKVVILKLDVSQLPGDLKFEQNVGGENKYYHLYNGSIPRSAVVTVEIRKV